MKHRELNIATAPTRTTTTWKNAHYNRQDLTAKAFEPHTINLTTSEYHQLPKNERDNHKDVGGFVAGHLKHGTRRKGHVLSRSLITLDLDNLPAHLDLPDHLTTTLDCAWLAHTTISHTAQRPRWRLWIWLSENVTAEQYGAISRRLAQDINPGLDWFDSTTFEPERFMYWPATLTDGDYQVHTSPATTEECDPGVVLGRYETWSDMATWPGVTPEQAHNQSGGMKTSNPLEKPGMIGAFNLAYPITKAIEVFLPTVYTKGTTRDRYTYTEGTSTNGLIIYNNDSLCYSQHATDPANDGHTHSAFDLVRIHKYGHLDTPSEALKPANKRASYVAMTEFVAQDTGAKQANAQRSALQLAEAFANTTTTSEGHATTGEPPTVNTTPPSNSAEHPQPPAATDEEISQIANLLATLTIRKDGTPTPTITNFETIFQQDPRLTHISWNEHTNTLEATDPQALPWKKHDTGWTDNDEAQLKTYLARAYLGLYAPTPMRDALLSVATSRKFHPVRNYFNNLPPWDGIPRLDTLLIDTLGAEDTPYTRAVTRKTLIAAVRRTFHPGAKFDQVLTLVGPQGVGKSTIFHKLAGQWFSDSLTITDMRDKTGAEKLAGNLIVEISELAGMRKTEAEPVKAFVSRTEDKYRPAYGRHVETYRRQCVIVGTTNAEEGFLRDPTGNRRWWVVPTPGAGSVKAQGLDAATIDQIWAEAKHYESQGEKLYLEGELAQAAAVAQTTAVETDERTGLVAEYLEKPVPRNWGSAPLSARRLFLDQGTLPAASGVGGFGEPYQPVGELVPRETVSKIEIWAECFRREPEAMRKQDAYEISAIMQKIEGWENTGEQRRSPVYGKQRIYRRTNVHG